MKFRLAWLGLLPLAIVLGLAGEALIVSDPSSGTVPLWRRLAGWTGAPAPREALPIPAEPAPMAGARPDEPAIATATPRAELPVARPFTFSATRAGERLRLTGYVPSEAGRAELLAHARRILPTVEVEDGTQAAAGLDPDIAFDKLAAFTLEQLRELRSGTVELGATILSVRGEARDRTSIAAVRRALEQDLPAGTGAGEIALSAPSIAPFPFRARREAGSLVLGGYLPDETAKADLLDLVRRRFLSEAIRDEVRLADGAHAGFVRGVLFGMEQLSGLAAGEIAISDASLRIAGEAIYEQAAERLRQAIASAPPAGWQVSAEIRTRPSGARVDADLCQERIARRLEGAPIRFEGDGAELARESIRVLDDLAAIAKRCEARFEVAGHTGPGDAERNRELSFRRAKAVVDHLVKAGVDAGRLRAAGYGDAQPLAPNTSEENKARNARVELLAKKEGS